jgi:hypothetical protein
MEGDFVHFALFIPFRHCFGVSAVFLVPHMPFPVPMPLEEISIRSSQKFLPGTVRHMLFF